MDISRLLIFSLLLGSIYSTTTANNSYKVVDLDTNKSVLVLREIGGYCDSEKDQYTCFDYNDNENSSVEINRYIKEHGTFIKELIIENPSKIIFELAFKPLKALNELVIFGNDYDCDAIKSIPKQLLQQPSLEKIVFEGVRFPSESLDIIKRKYPHLTIEGKIAEY